MTDQPFKTLFLDIEKYQDMLDDNDMSETQKHEFLKTMWNLIVTFVDMGYGVHPAQQALDAQTLDAIRGKLSGKTTLTDADPVQCAQTEQKG